MNLFGNNHPEASPASSSETLLEVKGFQHPASTWNSASAELLAGSVNRGMTADDIRANAARKREANRPIEETARRKAKLALQAPPDWLIEGKSAQRLAMTFSLETQDHYDRRQLVVKALQQAEFEYRRSAARHDESRANEWLLKVAGLHDQLRQSMQPDPLYGLGTGGLGSRWG